MNLPVTVYINTLPVNHKAGGIKTFLLELLYAFASANTGISYCLICSPSNADIFEKIRHHSNFSFTIVHVNNNNPVKRIYFEQFKLKKHLEKSKNAVLLNICNIAVMNCPLPQITIVQAQMSIKSLRKTLPKHFITISRFHKIYYDFMLQPSLNKSAVTICISNFMKPFLLAPEHKKVVIHEGVNLSDFQTRPSSSNWIPEQPYILSLSTLFPHKNMDKLIQAFAILKRNTNLPHKLLIAGKDPNGKQLAYLNEIARSEKIEQDVIFTGWVKLEEVPALYRHASLFMYLSSVEFFGLPVLEAMACDVPVIAGNKMSIPEVVNDAGILTEPTDIETIAMQMQQVLTHESLRCKLIENGGRNIQEFGWDKTASRFEQVFHQVICDMQQAKITKQ